MPSFDDKINNRLDRSNDGFGCFALLLLLLLLLQQQSVDNVPYVRVVSSSACEKIT